MSQRITTHRCVACGYLNVTSGQTASYSTQNLCSAKIDDSGDDSGNDDPQELEPVEKGDTYKGWISKVIERRAE
jgi:hypothetical protein